MRAAAEQAAVDVAAMVPPEPHRDRRIVAGVAKQVEAEQIGILLGPLEQPRVATDLGKQPAADLRGIQPVAMMQDVVRQFVCDDHRDLVVGIAFEEAHAELDDVAIGRRRHLGAKQHLEIAAASRRGPDGQRARRSTADQLHDQRPRRGKRRNSRGHRIAPAAGRRPARLGSCDRHAVDRHQRIVRADARDSRRRRRDDRLNGDRPFESEHRSGRIAQRRIVLTEVVQSPSRRRRQFATERGVGRRQPIGDRRHALIDRAQGGEGRLRVPVGRSGGDEGDRQQCRAKAMEEGHDGRYRS